jgi:fatty-acyl-CoA synthase
VIIGGSALPKGLARAALDRGIDVFAGYGMSETCPILTLAQLTPQMLDGDAGAQVEIRTKTGLPIPLVDLRVVDERMNDVPHNGRTTGEVVVRAPWLAQGYIKDAENSEKLWRGGYLHTGDIGHIDVDGYLQITDRIKDVIKSGGEWVSSLEIEDVISQVNGVNEVAVIGVKDEKWGERPLALVVVRPGFPCQDIEKEIETHLKACVAKGMISQWAVPDRVVFVEALAKTSVGKIDKRTLRQQYEQKT